jgi:hypothetical protein
MREAKSGTKRASAHLIAIATALSAAGGAALGAGPDLNRNLFIGNSLTATNDLPAMVAQTRLVSGEPMDFFQRSATIFGVGLDNHWADSGPQSGHGLLALGGWDGVVLQDLSFNATDAPTRTRTYVRLWDSEIKAQSPDATTFLFAYWERLDRPGSIGTINSLYQSLGAELDATVVPVGTAWERIKVTRPDIQLYTDAVHPTRHATYLSAAVFCSSIYGQNPVGFVPPSGITMDDALALQNAAWDVVSGRQTAVDRNWVGEGGGDWNVAANWGGNDIPAAGDRLILSQNDGVSRVINYVNPSGASVLLGSLSISAQSGSMKLSHERHTLRLAGTLNVGDAIAGGGEYLLGGTGKLFAARDERIARGSFVQQGGKNTVIGKLIVGQDSGVNASYVLNDGLLSAHVIEVKPGGTFTQNSGRLLSDRFELMGGAVNGTLRNRGLFNYSSGSFQGKLINEGTAMLGANGGKIATAEAGAGAQMEIEVSGTGQSWVIASANQDLRSLVVRYGNDGEQGFDLASGGGPGAHRSIRIYPGDAAAITSAERELSAAVGHALHFPRDGIFDSGMDERSNMRVGLARRVDVHQDEFLLLRPTVIGDLNIDGQVSISDFIDLAAHFGSANSTWEDGDINYDGNVSIADFIELAANFGSSFSGEVVPVSGEDRAELAAFAAANVPEPGGLVVAGIVAMSLAMRRRRRQAAYVRGSATCWF